MDRIRLPHLAALLFALACALGALADDAADYLSDTYDALVVDSRQGWGALGLNTATVPGDGRTPAALRIGETVYEKGLGHHAPGDLVFHLPEGEYTSFTAEVGVHWQGGGQGSVIFQVFVDGEQRFESETLSDSSARVSVNVPLTGARELKLVSLDAGDGIACDMANWVDARLHRDPNAPRFGSPSIEIGAEPVAVPSAEVGGFSLIANDTGPQIAALGRHDFAVCVRNAEEVTVAMPVYNMKSRFTVQADASVLQGPGTQVRLSVGGALHDTRTLEGGTQRLAVSVEDLLAETTIALQTIGGADESLVRWQNIQLITPNRTYDLYPLPKPSPPDDPQPRELPPLRPAMEMLLVEWDWRMQDGIGTEREPVMFAIATERLLSRAERLIQDLEETGVPLEPDRSAWQAFHDELAMMSESNVADANPRCEDLWRRAHQWRRQLAFANPLADVGPLLFVKRVPSAFSHQLTQYYGSKARAGGGLFVLDRPGESMTCRQLTQGQLPPGSYMQPDVDYDGQRILFAYCEVPSNPTPENREECLNRHYRLYEIRPDGSGLRQLTDGPYDDFSPRIVPSGEIMFISTRRGGYHRCGAGPCDVYTLALANADGSNPRTVSYHETQEWDPAVLADGRIIYTRWDYVDRNAVHYQQLWTVRPDGSAPAAYYGNNTFNPVGVWEARQVPGSPRVMATAAAHHAMTAGSIILLDTTKGVDGLSAVTRLTPDAPFPESETHVLPRNWHAPGSPTEYATPEEAKRWPGHCYRTPYPLSEKYFLVAYSFDPLIGEPDANKPNMFGVYLADAFGNKELIYRDLAIASQWPTPLRPRPRPPVIPPWYDTTTANEGTFFLQDVYASEPALPRDTIKQLRVVQVLPKTTPNANDPTVGLANASPGKQVLGTVPVEPDGSAYFSAPAGIPLAFQALDERGQAVQVMRSLTYLQPGEQASCVGCHEHRLSAPPPAGAKPLALERPPSTIEPGPDGSNPLSYPILVQPVLDRLCIRCHDGAASPESKGNSVVLTGDIEGRYTKSYNVLAPRVRFSEWQASLEANNEPATQPGAFGARASSLMAMLREGHEGVELDTSDLGRLITWMDANALFYGTFDPADQARQQRGERIEGPALQ